MAQKLGCTVVGMSGAIETLLLRYLGIKVTMLSVIANYGAGMINGTINHSDVLSAVKSQSDKIALLVQKLFK